MKENTIKAFNGVFPFCPSMVWVGIIPAVYIELVIGREMGIIRHNIQRETLK
jgi:hypothetical protein